MSEISIDVLKHSVISRERGLPLHLQVQSALREAIEEHFEDGQSFWTESLLVERLGVSRATVRQALGELSRQGLLVRQAARGTTVSKAAPTSTLSVFIHLYPSDFQNELLAHIAHECLQRDVRLQFHHTLEGEPVARAFEQMRSAAGAGKVLIFGDNVGSAEHLRAAVEEHGQRAVVVDALSSRQKGSYVGTDNEAAVQIGVSHLRELGHERIALLVNEPGQVETVRRKVAAFEKLVRGGLHQGAVVDCGTRRGDSSFEAAYIAMERLWALRPRPTAIFTVSDPGAWAALKWLAERRVEVPREVSVLGFEGVLPSAWTQPALSTVAHPLADLARTALDVLCENRSGQRFLSPRLVLRDSTAQAPETT